MAAKTATKDENVVPKKNDAYTGFLAISFLAMVGATVLLYLEYQNYEGKPPPKAPPIDVPGAQLKVIPGSGGAPKPPPPPPPDPMPDPNMPPPMTRLPAPPSNTGIVQAQAVEPVSIVEIPELKQAPVKVKPVIASAEPDLNDAPPLPTGRFDPLK